MYVSDHRTPRHGQRSLDTSGGSAPATVRSAGGVLESTGKGSSSGGKFRESGFTKLPDSDGDSIPDEVENAQGLDANANDADADADGDGIPNGVEFRLRTAANSADSNNDGQSDGLDDSDLDGIPNAVEVALGLDPYAPDSDNDGIPDGAGDYDGDGIGNADEIKTGTDPGVSDTPAPVEEPDPARGRERGLQLGPGGERRLIAHQHDVRGI